MLEDMNLFYNRHKITSSVEAISEQKIHFYELTILIKGNMTYYVDGKEAILHEGDLVLIPPHCKRKRLGGSFAEYLSLNFRSNELFDYPNLTKGFVDKEVTLIIKLFDSFTADPVGSMTEKCEEITKLLLLKLCEYYNSPKYSKLTLSIIEYLKAHLSCRITLSELERHLFLSSNYLDKVFKSETGQTIVQYFNFMKLERAKTLIMEQTHTLTEISSTLGFSDYNYFCRLFKKTYAVTPTNFKNQFTAR